MIGTRLGAYEILAELGTGGMGTVYRAESDGAFFALKVIHAHLLETPGFFKRFLREAEVGRTIQHENVVRTYDCDALLVGGVQQNFLVMEYVEGQTLRDLVLELERVPEELCRHIGREVAKGLAAIHAAGVVHRDLKPENVLITVDHVVKVMDLGVARLQDEAIRLSQTGAFVGSFEYAAPEQFKGDAAPDGRADLYALGVVLYELATGRHPYRDADLTRLLHNILEMTPRRAGEVHPQLSPFFEEVLQTLLDKKAEGRFASASDLGLVLEEGEEGAWWLKRAKALQLRTRRPIRRIRIPRETALYGRDAELARFRDRYERAKAGEGQVLLIEGEAGIGKTRLVDELVGTLLHAGEDLDFLFGSYPPGGAATAATAFATAYAEQFGPAGSGSYLKETPVLVPAFDALLRGEPPGDGVQPLTKESLQTVFVRATCALASERPTVVLIDDLHFAPEEGRALFASLAQAVPEQRILLIGTTRPGLPEDWRADLERLPQTSRIDLARLGPKDLGDLLVEVFRSEQLAEDLALRIARKSDGNPFFVFEIIQGLRDGHFIQKGTDGSWVTTQVIRDIEIPSSVQDLIQARMVGLDETEQEILDVAACCGFEFDGALVAETLGEARIPTFRRLGRMEKARGLVRSVGARYAFDHYQVQKAVYEGVAAPLRQEYHAAIAEALLARHGRPEGMAAVELVEHFLRAGQGARAVALLPAALDHLERTYQNEKAVQLADLALGAPGLLEGAERVRVLLRKDGRLYYLGDREGQETVLAEARTLVGEANLALLGEVESSTGYLHLARGRFPQARDHFQRFLAAAVASGDASDEMRATGCVGQSLVLLGQYDEAETLVTRCLEAAEKSAETKAEISARNDLGRIRFHQGRYEEARRQFDRARALAREAGDRRSELVAVGNLGNIDVRQGRMADATDKLERGLVLSREIGERAQEERHLANLGAVALLRGDFDAARSSFGQALDIARQTGDRNAEAIAGGNLGVVLYVLGRYAEARALLTERLAIARELGDRRGECLALENLGNVDRVLGRHAESRRRHTASLELARELGFDAEAARVLLSLGVLCDEEGDAEGAERRIREALAVFSAGRARSDEADALLQLGGSLVRSGRVEEAGASWREALAVARETDSGKFEVLALAHLATLEGGEVAAAREALARHEGRMPPAVRLSARFLLWKAGGQAEDLEAARRILDELVEHAPEADRETMVEKVRLYREVREAAAPGGSMEATRF